MTIKSSTIKTGATSLAATGGDDQVLDPLVTSGNSTQVLFDGDTDYASRRTVKFTATEPTVQASSPDGYSKVRKSIVVKFPTAIAAGGYTVDTFRIEHAHSVEASASTVAERLKIVAQLLFDSQFADFHEQGSLE